MSNKENGKEKSTKEEVEMAVQKYGILMSYLQYENSSFWDRNNFFIIANTALLGFLIQKLPNICPPPTSWENIIIPLVYSIAGLLLSLLWRSGLKISEEWINHWINEIKDNGVENFPNSAKKIPGAKKNAFRVVWLFFAFWIILILYLLLAIFMKLCQPLC